MARPGPAPVAAVQAVSAQAAASELGWGLTEAPPTLELQCGGAACTLWFNSGELWTKGPGPWEIDAMLTLAAKLGARVRDDDYETYVSPDDTYRHSDDAQLQKEDEARSLELLRRDPFSPERMRHYIVGFFVVLCILGYSVGKWFER